MKLIIKLALIIACITFAVAYFFYPDTKPVPPFEGSMEELNEYGVNLFKKVFDGKTNTFVSHIPYFTAINAVHRLASASDKNEIDTRMGFSVGSQEITKNTSLFLFDLLEGRKGIEGELNTFAFLDDDFTLDEESLQSPLFGFSHIIEVMNLPAPDGHKKVSKRLCKSIGASDPSLINGQPYPEFTALVLASAMKYKGSWSTQFKDDTIDTKFFPENGEPYPIELLEKEEETFQISSLNKCQAAYLPIGTEDYGYLLLLPREGEKLGEFVNSLALADIEELIAGLYDSEVTLQLPEFEIKSRTELSFAEALDPTGAHPEITIKLTEKIWRTKGPLPGEYVTPMGFEQRNIAKLTRSGVEVVTITECVLESECEQCDFGPIVFNRPFVFMLVHRKTHSIAGFGTILRVE